MRNLVSGAIVLVCGTIAYEAAQAQCPPKIGADTGCGAMVTVTSTGAAVTSTGMGPYDGSDDTLVGVVNNIPKCITGKGSSTTVTCGIPIYSLDLTSTNDICSFDSDGVTTYGVAGNAQDTTGYGGPNAYFTPIPPATTTNPNQCRINFIKPIPPGGGTDYFSLENALSSASNTCTKAINNSICDAYGANCGGTTPLVPSIIADPKSGRLTQIQATFIPQGIDPATGKKYTLAAAALACGFTAFDWQQTITALPTANFFAIANPTVPLVAPFNDPPVSGYTYMQKWTPNGSPGPINAPQVPVYYDPYNTPQATTAGGDLSLKGNTNVATNTLSFFDNPANSILPTGTTINFTTHLVGLGTGTPYPVIDTGMGFVWTSNNNGSVGGIAVTSVPKGTTGDTGGTGGVTVTSVTQTSTYTGVAVNAVNGSSLIFGPTPLLAAILPESRSAQPGSTITAFVTIINSGTTTLSGCSIAPAASLKGTFIYQTTNSLTNALTGTVNTPVDIAGNNASQSFVIGFTPTAALTPTDVGFTFSCTNSTPAQIVTGLDTLLLSASTTTPTPDIIALGATTKNDGIVHVVGPGAFAVATDNLGSGDTITVAANTGAATLPLAITLCQTNSTTGQCLAAAAKTVTATIAAKATSTFGIFVTASGSVPFDPANSRIFVTFTDSTNAVRGETSVAVETQ